MQPLLFPEMNTSAPAPCRFHAGHVAFMRATIIGLDRREAERCYLGAEGGMTGPRAIARTVAQLRQVFAQTASAYGRYGLARLLRIDLTRAAGAQPAPPFDVFVETRGLQDVPFDAQRAAFQAHYGPAGSASTRGERLLRKQLDGLRWIERLALQAPHPDDPVHAWLAPELASRLESANLSTMRQLVERINGVGAGWHAGIAGIGAGKAARIQALLRAHAVRLGLAIGPHVHRVQGFVQRMARLVAVPRATAVVPIEKFLVPAALDGSAGRFRAPRALCLLAANTDFDALMVFIKTRASPKPPPWGWDVTRPRASRVSRAGLHDVTATQRAYLTECERFMLWTILVRGKELSSITLEDGLAYRDFLGDPQPAAQWVGQRGRARWGPAWRPFAGPLSPAAQRRALAVLGAFYGFLVDQGYLVGNPWAGMHKPRVPRGDSAPERSLTQQQWAYVRQELAGLEPTSANWRLRVALPLMYGARLRRSEAVAAKVSDIRWEPCAPSAPGEGWVAGWELTVTGKGGKVRHVPLAYSVVADLQAYLVSRGLEPDVLSPSNQATFLLGRAVDIATRAPWSTEAHKPVDRYGPIGAQTLYDQLKAFFARCATRLHATDPAAAAQLARASAHWLRHTGITHAQANGTPLDVEMAIAGHTSPATTAGYTQVERRRLLLHSGQFLARQDADSAAAPWVKK